MMFCPRHDAASSSRAQTRQIHSSARSANRENRRRFVRPLRLESLEPRLALSADVAPDLSAALTHGGA